MAQYKTNQLLGVYDLVLDINVASQSIANNTTTLNYKLTFTCNNGYYSCSYVGNGGVFLLKIDGTQVAINSNPSYTCNSSTPYVAFNGSKTITHGSDGTKSISIEFSRKGSAYFNAYSPSADMSKTVTMALPTIPRASTPSASSVTVGSAVTINTNRAASAFTHTISYKIGSASGTIGTGVGASVSWTPSKELARQFPNSTSGSCTITCVTYNGSTNLGTKTCTINLNASSDMVPSVSSIATAETVSGLSAKFGGFVQNRSKIRFTPTASGSYGSTIKSYAITFCGSTATWNSGTIDRTPTLSGSQNATVTVTDSRGRTGSKTVAVSVLAYSIPVVNQFKVARVNDSGEESEAGTKAKIYYKFTIASVNSRNNKNVKIYKEKSDGTWESLKEVTDKYTETSGVYLPTDTFSTDSSFNFKIVVSDYFYTESGSNAIENHAILERSAVLINFGANGRSMGFGGLVPTGSTDRIYTYWTNIFMESIQLKKNTITEAYICNKMDAWPGYFIGENADGKKRWEIYGNTNNGSPCNTRLDVYTDANGTTKKSFDFKTDGRFSCGGVDSTGSVSATSVTASGEVKGSSIRTTSKLTYVPTTGNSSLRFSSGTIVLKTGAYSTNDYFTNSVMQGLLGNDKTWNNQNSVLIVANGDANALDTGVHARWWPGGSAWSVAANSASDAPNKNLRFNYLLVGW